MKGREEKGNRRGWGMGIEKGMERKGNGRGARKGRRKGEKCAIMNLWLVLLQISASSLGLYTVALWRDKHAAGPRCLLDTAQTNKSVDQLTKF